MADDPEDQRKAARQLRGAVIPMIAFGALLLLITPVLLIVAFATR